MTENDRPQLEYAQPSPWHRRRSARRVLLLCIALLLLGATMRWGHQILIRIKTNYWFNQAMGWTAPPDQVAYERRGSNANVTVPEPWQNFYQLYTGSAPLTLGTLFVHERTSRGGNRRLVAADAVAVDHPHAQVHATVRVFAPPLSIAWPKQRTAAIATLEFPSTDRSLRIFAGQPDPKDPSHFTMMYEFGEQRGVIDGWLKDDDNVLLELRRDPAAATNPVTSPAQPSPAMSP